MAEAEQLLRIRDVTERVGVSRATIYLWLTKGEFPEPRRIGASAVAWLESELVEWMRSRPKAGYKAGTSLHPTTAKSRR